MTDGAAPNRDAADTLKDFRAIAESAGVTLKERLRDKGDSATKTYGFDSYDIKDYLDVLEPVMSHKELRERHRGEKLLSHKIFVSTKTIKHDEGKTSNVTTSETARKGVWLLALFVDQEEKMRIGQSFSLDTRFNVVEGDVFVGFEVV